jgi:hypothetical protein
MARITTNTTGTQPHLYVSTDTANIANAALSVICLQDITITNSTGIFSWTDFCSIDTNKVTTPADNEITTNVVLDPENWFGNANATANTATYYGVSGLSINKIPVSFQIVLNGDDTANTGAFYYEGIGYISSLAPTVSPDAPVWVSPLTIAVDGDMTTGQL